MRRHLPHKIRRRENSYLLHLYTYIYMYICVLYIQKKCVCVKRRVKKYKKNFFLHNIKKRISVNFATHIYICTIVLNVVVVVVLIIFIIYTETTEKLYFFFFCVRSPVLICKLINFV